MKNTTTNKTEWFKAERQNELDFIKARPYYGSDAAEKMYKILKKRYNILQVGVCGLLISVVSYKKDAIDMLMILNKMFPTLTVKQRTSEYTGLITTYTIPKK